jgi:AcrR family transcriptional regulator
MNSSDDQRASTSDGLIALDAVQRVVERSVADRVEEATKDVRRLVAATYAVIEQTGSTDLSLRSILAAAGWSNQAFYRYFDSKDDLLVALLLAGLRRLADDLRYRMSLLDDPAQRVDAWVRCVLEQASDQHIAAQTRPFIGGLGRLEARFPSELRQSRDVLIATLADALPPAQSDAAESDAAESDAADRSADAGATYDLAFGAMQRHLLARTSPAPGEVDILVRYAQRALGV